jgi:lysozyme family protein
MATDNPAFRKALNFVLAAEGGTSTDPKDSGNWTGGAQGKGTLLGTRFGISAAAYPTLDIPRLSIAEAGAIYFRDYWAPVGGESIPAKQGMLMMDAAVQHGVGNAVKLAQRTCGIAEDGVCGPVTIAAIRTKDTALFTVEYLGHRAHFYAKLKPDQVARFGYGWMKRLFELQAAL